MRLLALLPVALLLPQLACARGPDVSAGDLALRRVVVYRNGVGYFERAGRVDDDEVTFRVRKERVGDFLATLAIIERGGSSVRSASFPIQVGEEEVGPPGEEDPPVRPLRRRRVIVPDPPRPRPRDDRRADGDEMETVTLSLDGEEHVLEVGYVAETPVWRPSYRLVIEKDQASLQAWGIVQNLSGEDWKDVKLSLIAGAPLAFQATLDVPVVPERPVVTDRGEVIESVPVAETSLPQAPPSAAADAVAPPQPAAPASPAPRGGVAEDEDEGGYGYGLAAEAAEGKAGEATSAQVRRKVARAPASPPPAQAPRPEPGRPRADLSPPRRLSALAAVAMEAGTTRYDLPHPVTIPDRSATMVLLLARKVRGESIYLYAPDGGVPDSASHPFRVARFVNETDGLLERGPIAVFERGAFLGQGMVDPLPRGATATVPFALERGVGVTSERTSSEEGARLAHIEHGRIEVERDIVLRTRYAVRSGAEEDVRLLVKHPRTHGARLHEPPKGTEDNVGTGSALIPVTVRRRSTGSLVVDERSASRRNVDWLDPIADDAVRAYLADRRADAAVVAPLRAAWEVRDKLRAATDERKKIADEEQRLRQQADELRRNLRAIEKNPTAEGLRRELTERLARISSRLDELTKRGIVVEMQVNELSIRFRDLVGAIRMVQPIDPRP